MTSRSPFAAWAAGREGKRLLARAGRRLDRLTDLDGLVAQEDERGSTAP